MCDYASDEIDIMYISCCEGVTIFNSDLMFELSTSPMIEKFTPVISAGYEQSMTGSCLLFRT